MNGPGKLTNKAKEILLAVGRLDALEADCIRIVSIKESLNSSGIDLSINTITENLERLTELGLLTRIRGEIKTGQATRIIPGFELTAEGAHHINKINETKKKKKQKRKKRETGQ